MSHMSNMLALGLNVTLVSDIFRVLFFFIDGLIYSLIPIVYSLIYSLYDFSKIFAEGTLENILTNMTDTVYSFLAIFMFFRVAFSLITMLIDPSVIDDKNNGAKKIVTNIMICLLLIVAVPWVFKYAKIIQARVLDQHLIEKVVTGNEFNDDSYDLGNEIALSTWSVFLHPASDSSSDIVNAYKSVFQSGNTDWNLVAMLSDLNDVSADSIFGQLFGRYLPGTHYQLAYIYLLSTIAGIYVLWVFIKMMLDVAYRSIKFFVLELLSPIAIVSYIDPSSSKKGVFSKWLNETVKTYVSLFIRIFIFSFASVLLRTFSLSNMDTGKGIFVNLFYILAIIAFLKNGPKFIDSLFGTSISKEKESNLSSAMKSVLGFGGMIAGAAAGGISNANVAKRVGKNKAQVAWAGIKGAWSGGAKGLQAGKKGGFGGLIGASSNAIGAYGEAKKNFGFEEDREQEKLINAMQNKVDNVNNAKTNAVDDLMANGRQKYNEKLSKGAKVNGRKYGMGLENDEGLENLFKKNAGGLAQDELLHQGDEKYLELRRAVAKGKDDEAILSRVNSLARSQYSAASAAYNSSDDKAAYVVSFEMDTAQMEYGRMDDKTLKEAYAKELQMAAVNYVTGERQKFDLANKEQKVNLFVNATGLDRNNVEAMSDIELTSEYQRILNQTAQTQLNDRVSNYTNAVSHNDRINLMLDVKQENLISEVSGYSGAKLTDRFDSANEARIVATFGQSLTNIDADSTKASGDAKKAQTALDEYLKSGNGKKAKNIDSAFATADAREKAKKLAEERKKNSN